MQDNTILFYSLAPGNENKDVRKIDTLLPQNWLAQVKCININSIEIYDSLCLSHIAVAYRIKNCYKV